MPIPPLTSLPRPALFGLYGTAAGLLAALLFGEPVWWLLRPPSPEAAAYTAPPAPRPAQLAVTLSPRVSVYPGWRNTINVRVARSGFEGPVAVKFASPIAGLSASDLTIPPSETSGVAAVAATVGVKPGVYRLTATAVAPGETLVAPATVEVAVVPLPPPAPRLAVSVSPKIQVYQGGKNTFDVRVARREYTGAIAFSFVDLPEGVTMPAVTVPADRNLATAEVQVEGGATPGVRAFAVAARGSPGLAAGAQANVEILAGPKLPLDVVFVLDTTRSMKEAVAGISGSVSRFAGEVRKGPYDPRLGLVAFQDTTLGQPLRILRVKGDRLTAEYARVGDVMSALRLGGGGGEGESSLDGIAEAADCTFRGGSVRVIVLITDGGPKRIDGRMKSMDEMVQYLRTNKIDQLHVVAVPEHRKAFEPLREGAKGQFFDLKNANAAESHDKLMAAVAAAIVAAAPKPPAGKPDPAAAAPRPVLAALDFLKPPALPSGEEPAEPKVVKPEGEVAALEVPVSPEPSAGSRLLASVAWMSVVVVLATLAVALGQFTILPGDRPAIGVAAVGYGGGVVAGVAAGTVGYGVLVVLGVPLLARLSAGSLFGLCLGLAVPLAERLVLGMKPVTDAAAVPGQPLPVARPRPAAKPLELDDQPLPPRAVEVIKPNITAPKPIDGCPGCGRKIPGSAGERYCMLCDKTF